MTKNFQMPYVLDHVFPGFSETCSIVVGGASGGVGSALVRLLLLSGSTVIVVDENEEKTQGLRDSVGPDARIVPVLTDITTDAGIADLVSAMTASDRPVRHLVNVIGGVTVDDIGHFLELDSDQWARALSLNVTYALRSSQAVARVLAGERGGSIVNLSVADAVGAMPWFGFYASARSALESLTRTMAVELGPFDIRANSVSWGLINSPRMHGHGESAGQRERDVIPLRRRGLVSDVASSAMFLLSDLAAYITGQNLAVDGGLTLRGAHYEGVQNIPVFLDSPEVREMLLSRYSSLVDTTDIDGRS